MLLCFDKIFLTRPLEYSYEEFFPEVAEYSLDELLCHSIVAVLHLSPLAVTIYDAI